MFNNIRAILTISEGGPSGLVEPVSLTDAKTFLRISNTASDTLISSLINSSRNLIEKYLNKSLVPKALEVSLAHDGIHRLELPYGPVTMTADDVYSITSIFYRFGVRQAWVDNTSQLNNLFEFYGLNGCALMGNSGEYRIKYNTTPVTGEIFNTAIKQQVSFMFENRGDEQLYQLGEHRQANAIVCDIVRNTLAGQSNLTWLG